MNIIQAIEDKNLFRPFLADASGSLDTWSSWRPALQAVYGLPVGREHRKLIRECTGRAKLRKEGFNTTLFLTGRRSGKSRIAALCGANEAALAGHEKKLAKGERGVVAICAPTMSQSRIVTDYLRGIFAVPMLRREVVAETKSGFELANGNRVEIICGNWQHVRGYTLIAAIVDEICFFGYGDDSKIKSDTELIRALRPSLATVNGRLICISSPYAQKGWSYSMYRRHFGNDKSNVLVWNCPSRTMNPTLPQSIIDDAMAEDPAAARAEYLGEFRDDIATFLPRDVIEQVVVKGRTELPPRYSVRYRAFVDISGGRTDDAALAIGHEQEGMLVVDCLRRWPPPFSPDGVVGEMVAIMARYRCRSVVGDNYAAEWTASAFTSRGVRYTRCMKPKSQCYLELLPQICSGEMELLDNELLIKQLSNLERRTRSGGRDVIDHPSGPGQHDDLANVVAGLAAAPAPVVVTAINFDNPPETEWSRRVAEHVRELEDGYASMYEDPIEKSGGIRKFLNLYTHHEPRSGGLFNH